MATRLGLSNLRFRALDEKYVRECDPSKLAIAILYEWSHSKRMEVENMSEKQFRRMYAGEMIRMSRRFQRERSRFNSSQRRTHRILAGMTTIFDSISYRLVEILLNPKARRASAREYAADAAAVGAAAAAA